MAFTITIRAPRRSLDDKRRLAVAAMSMAIWPRLAIVAIFVVALAACGDKTKTEEAAKRLAPPAVATAEAKVTLSNPTDPQWVSQATPHHKIAVVFVHGIFGDTLGTWSAGGDTLSFFKLLSGVSDVGPQIDTYAFGFTSKMFGGGSLDIREAANKLHQSLEFDKVLDYQTIVFVGHSMGGLIILRELIGHRDEVLAKVPLVVLFAAPQEGADIARIADVVMKNPALGEMLQADNNAYLQTLDEDWKRVKLLPVHPFVACGYETKPTYGVKIVQWTSSTRFCDDGGVAIEATDHISVVKPDREAHPSNVVLVNALRKYVLPDVAARLDTPDFVAEGDHAVFTLVDPIAKTPARLVNAGRIKLRYTLAQISPNLYVWPDDTPRDIPGKGTEVMKIGLGFGASASEYQFLVESDAPTKERVIVRVPDIAAFRKKQVELADAINKDVGASLRDPQNVKALSGLAPNDPRADELFAKVVADAVAKETPGLPQHAQWVMAADFLTAQNLHQAAATALRRAETISPASAKSSSVRWLGALVATHSGQEKIFASVQTPTFTKDEIAKLPYSTRYADAAPNSVREGLARELKAIPALEAYGYSLEGDVRRASGDKQGAKAAYIEATKIQKTPSTDLRLEAVSKPSLRFDMNRAVKEPIPPSAPPARLPSQGASVDKFKGEVPERLGK